MSGARPASSSPASGSGDRGDDRLGEALARLAASALRARVVRLEFLPGGLGTRRFVRLHLEGARPATAVARIEAAPADGPAEPPLEPLRSLLEAHGLPVPARYGGDPRRGIELLEDVGADALETVVAHCSPAARRELYAEACALVPRLQALRDPDGRVPAFRRRLDRTLLEAKAELFVRWSLPACLGRPASHAEEGVVRDAFARVAEEVEAAPQRLAHRDFQSSNLHVRAGAARGGRLVMLDFQGAFLAPPEYDLVCLLRDSYVVLPEEEVAWQCERARERLPDRPGPDDFARRFDLLALARKGKDHARFLEAAGLRGDRRRLPHLAPTLAYVRAAAARSAPLDPRLRRFADLLETLSEGAAPCAP